MSSVSPAQRAQNTIAAEREAKAVADALEKLRKQLDPTRATLQGTEKAVGGFRAVVSGFQSVASMGGQATSAISAVGGGLSKIAGMAGPWGAAAGVMIGTVSQLPQLFKSAGDSIANYVQAFSPVAAQRYSQAWADLSAVIGSYLVPVLELATGVVRFFGDQVAGWQPVFQPVIDQLSQIGGSFGSAFGDVLNKFGEIGVVIGQVFTPFFTLMIEIGAGPLRLVTNLLSEFASRLGVLAQQLALFFGVELPKFEGGSQGVAARGTGQTNVQNLLSQLQQRAFALGGSGAAAKNYQMEAALTLVDLYTWITGQLPAEMAAAAAAIWQNIVQAITNAGKGAGTALQVGANAALNAVPGLGAGVEVLKQQLRQIVPGAPLPFGI